MVIGSNLQDILPDSDHLVAHMRNLPTDTWEFVGVPSEFTNWRDEQLAGHHAVALLHQGHMRQPISEFYVEGPDAFRLLRELGSNSFEKFVPGMAKQYVVCNHEGYLIGDCILFYLEEERFCLVGAMVLSGWIRFQAARRGYHVRLSDEDSVREADGSVRPRPYYQLQIQGPHAKALIEDLNGSFPDLKFFRIGKIRVAGHDVHCLTHSMLGEPGLECWFPLEHRDAVVDAIVAAGERYGLKQIGTRTYASQTLESGWIGLPVPAIFSGEEMEAYRRFLPADAFEAIISIAGSFVGERIEDYYYTPYDMNYGGFVRFDHDFIGRTALEALRDGPHRRKVTLEWNPDDVARIHASFSGNEDLPYKWMDLPYASYGMVQCDRVSRNGRTVGRSSDVGYSHYARSTISLAVVDPDIAIGDEVIVTWGEEAGGTRKNAVERHRQIDVRAIVHPAPFTKVARESYQTAGWRAVASAPA